MTTLTTVRERLETTLQDASNERWSSDDLDEAIRRALEEFSLVEPHEQVTTLTLSSAGREIDISSLSNCLQVSRVWWPYEAADPEHPPRWRPFEVWGDTLYLDTDSKPATGDVVRLWYTEQHTLDGLDGASSTTLPPDAETILIAGAAGFAAQARAAELSETLNVDAGVVQRLSDYAKQQSAAFHILLTVRARQAAARQSGVVQTAALDRWEKR